MANFFPCPNPACTYQFDADQLPAAAMVTCPICRTRFPYRAAAPAPQASETEPAAFGEDDNPFASSPSAAASSPSRGRPNRLVNPVMTPRGSKTQTTIMILGFFIVIASGVAVMIFRSGKRPSERMAAEYKDYGTYNFRLRKFDDSKWRDDVGMRTNLKVSGIAIKRSDPGGWFVIHVKDFKTKNPRPSEMRSEMMSMLRDSMKDTFKKEPIDNVKVAGEPAEGIRFQGRMADTEVFGEGFAFHYKGIGYVLMYLAPVDSWNTVEKELHEFRDSFSLLNNRENWVEKVPPSKQHYLEGGHYMVEDHDAIWERALVRAKPKDDPEDKEAKTPDLKRGTFVLDNLADYDPKATMVFRGRFPIRNRHLERDLIPTAQAMVLELDGGDLESARKYIHDKLQREEGSERDVKISFDPAPKSPSGTPIPPTQAAVGLFNSINSEDKSARKFWVIGTLNVDGKLLVAASWCPDRDSEWMEPYMLNLVASLKERK